MKNGLAQGEKGPVGPAKMASKATSSQWSVDDDPEVQAKLEAYLTVCI